MLVNEVLSIMYELAHMEKALYCIIDIIIAERNIQDLLSLMKSFLD